MKAGNGPQRTEDGRRKTDSRRLSSVLCPPSSVFCPLASPLVLMLLLLLCPGALASWGSWHVPDAVLKFTIEADPNRLQVPNVDIHGRETRGGTWSGGYYGIDGKLYKDAVAMRCPADATFRCPDGVRRFVALVGVRQDAGDSASIVFEVFADTRKLYTSRPMTKYQPPTGIDVRVPPRAKQVRLVTTGSDSHGHHWAGWVNTGFWTQLDDPRVGYVTLPVPGFDPSQYEAVVFTGDGKQVAGMPLGTPQEGKVDQLFFAGHGWPTYCVYWVPKDSGRVGLAPPNPVSKKEPVGQAPPYVPNAGLILETRRLDKGRRKACEDLAGFVKVWDEADEVIGRSFVGGIHHGHPVHPDLMTGEDKAAKDDLALYRYTGFFEADKPGEYVFATASHWGSHLLVDDQPVVSWPGNHDYRGGIRGQKQGKVVLQPGIHKLEYLNYSPWGTMFTLAAWQPPKGKLSVMTESDFPAVRGYAVTGVEYNPDARKQVSFDWNVVDDWRPDRDKMALIRMQFKAIPDRAAERRKGQHESSPPPAESDGAVSGPSLAGSPHLSLSGYRWTFEDGVTGTGRVIERVFFGPGRHTVAVSATGGLADGQVLAETRHAMHAGTLTEKIWVDPRDPNAFRREISKIDLGRAPIEDVVRLRTFGQEISESAWENAATQVLLQRVDGLTVRPEQHPLCLELAQYLASAPVQQYDRAMSLCTKLQEKTVEGTAIRQHTMVLAGELLVQCLGRPDAALRSLNQARWEKAQDRTWTIRLGLARAEALLALGQTDELDEQMRQMGRTHSPQEVPHQDLRHAGLLHRAEGLIRARGHEGIDDDPTSLDTAMDNLQTILYENPAQVLSPSLNLARLDIHLARGEYRIAHHLAERLVKLDLSTYDRAQVLVRHMKALCEMGSLDLARGVLEELTRAYPDSEQASRAKAMMVKAMTDALPR